MPRSMVPVKITGERVSSPEGGFNPTWQRHVAAYALSVPDLGPGRVLDLGCGVGHSYDRLAPRETVGVDVDAAALAGQRRPTVVADMRELPFPDASFASVLSVQSSEHVPDPAGAVAEAARVLEPDGTAVFVTPNRLTLGRSDEIIDPYHHVEFDAAQLAALCRRSFGRVQVRGLFGSARYMELFDEERRRLDRLLALDPLRVRRLVPLPVKQWLYDLLLRRYRRDEDPRAAVITPEDFHWREEGLEGALDLCAVCHDPRPPGRCIWCGAPFDARAARLAGRTRCGHCGAATIDPFPSGEELTRAYGDWYRPASGRRFGAFGDALLARTRGALAARLDAVAPPGPVLDVGAGDGVLLDALRRRGREAVGLERDSPRPDVRTASLDDVEGEFAAVVFWHSLEHLPEPGAAIGHAARLLPPGGLLVVAVPDAASLQARLFGDRWLHLDPPRHLVHLTRGALLSGLEHHGFVAERRSALRGGQVAIGWLDGLVGSLPGGLRLYPALRAAGARDVPMAPRERALALAAAVLLTPVALAGAALEAALGRSGTVYVEARRG
jgi:SAM-dependent methyltransferase